MHAVEHHRRGFDDYEWRKLPRHHLAGDARQRVLRRLRTRAVRARSSCPKRRYSAFFATDLALFLHEQRIDRVVIAGVKTNVCIRATVQDAFAHGFEPVVPHEATNSNRPHLAAASLEDIDRYMGRVVSLAERRGMLA